MMKTKGNPPEPKDSGGFMNLDSNLDIFDISQITSRFLKDATRRSSVCPIQHFDPVVSHQRLHHLFGAGVESQQALTLGNALPDQLRIDALQVCQNDQLLEACFITDIAWAVRVCLPPFLCSNTNRATFRASASPAQVRLSRRRDISQCANVLPFLPALEKIPIALGRPAFSETW